MLDEFAKATEAFKLNAQTVYDLLDFDRYVLEFAAERLQALVKEFEDSNRHNEVGRLQNVVLALRNVKQNDSLRPHYETIFNQCVVLLVSYFGSIVHDLFRCGVVRTLKSGSELPLLKEEIRVTWRELASS